MGYEKIILLTTIPLIISLLIIKNYFKKKKNKDFTSRYVNDGETGHQIKQIKANGFNSQYSITGSNSTYIGSKQ
jgi:hypothetical protein